MSPHTCGDHGTTFRTWFSPTVWVPWNQTRVVSLDNNHLYQLSHLLPKALWLLEVSATGDIVALPLPHYWPVTVCHLALPSPASSRLQH